MVNVSAWPAVLCSFTRGLGGDVAALLVPTQSFKITPSLFPSLKEFKDENKTDVCTFRNKINVLCTCLFTEQMAEYSVTLKAKPPASKFSRIRQNVA